MMKACITDILAAIFKFLKEFSKGEQYKQKLRLIDWRARRYSMALRRLNMAVFVTLRQLKVFIKGSILGIPLKNKVNFNEEFESFHAFTKTFNACICYLHTTKR